MSVVWSAWVLLYDCPRCHVPAGVRCRTTSGRRAGGPHVARLVERMVCPACGHVDTDPVNVRHGYCSVCRDWTAAGRGLAAQDVLEGL